MIVTRGSGVAVIVTRGSGVAVLLDSFGLVEAEREVRRAEGLRRRTAEQVVERRHDRAVCPVGAEREAADRDVVPQRGVARVRRLVDDPHERLVGVARVEPPREVGAATTPLAARSSP